MAASTVTIMSDSPDIKFTYEWTIENLEKEMDEHFDESLGNNCPKIVSPTFIVPQFPKSRLSIELSRAQEDTETPYKYLQKSEGVLFEISRMFSLRLNVETESESCDIDAYEESEYPNGLKIESKYLKGSVLIKHGKQILKGNKSDVFDDGRLFVNDVQHWRMTDSHVSVLHIKQKGDKFPEKIDNIEINRSYFFQEDFFTYYPGFYTLELEKENAMTITMTFSIPRKPSFIGHTEYETLIGLKSLLKDPKHSDLVLVCEGEKIAAHKAILSCRSPVFDRMLQTCMKEGNTGEIIIEDMTPNTLRILLEFIYAGTVDDITEGVEEVLYAADKYEMISLVDICVENMKELASPENILHFWNSAERHSLQHLKQFIIKKIESEEQYFKNNPIFLENVKNCHTLLFALFENN